MNLIWGKEKRSYSAGPEAAHKVRDEIKLDRRLRYEVAPLSCVRKNHREHSHLARESQERDFGEADAEPPSIELTPVARCWLL